MSIVDIAQEPPPELRYRHKVSLAGAVRGAWGAREVVGSLVERQLRARYKQSLLGMAWAVTQPVLLMVVFTFVFGHVAKVDTKGAPYPIFTYIALVPWTFFSASVVAAGQSIVGNMSLINKMNCPREVFPLATVGVAAVDAVISAAVLGVLFAVETFAPRPAAAWVPLLLVIQLLVTLGWALLVSSITVYLRDLMVGLPLLLQVLLFVSPVAYSLTAIPAAIRTAYCVVNPLGMVIDSYRRTVLQGLAPSPHLLIAGAAGAVGVFLLGLWSFKRLEVGFADLA